MSLLPDPAALVPEHSPLRSTSHGQLLHRPADLRHGPGLADAARSAASASFCCRSSLYPEIVPPQVQVTTTYTGADAQTVADTVTTPIEQQINGVKGHDLLQLGQHQQRRVADRGHLRRRLLAGHRRRRHPEQGGDGARPVSRRGQAVRRDDQEDVDQHGLRRQPDLARRPVRRELPRQLRPDQRRRRPEADPRGQRRQPSSAASTPCGSGSTRTGWPTSRSRPTR